MAHHQHTSSGRGDGTAVESHQIHADMSFMSRSQDLAGLDVGTTLLSVPFPSTSPILSTYHGQPPAVPISLEQWYTRNDGPWIPQNLAPTGQNVPNTRGHRFGYPGPYRESISPSECETAPPGYILSDSGYGSHGGAKQSVTTASIYEAPLDSLESQRFMGDFSKLMSSGPWVSAQPQAQMSNMHRTIPSNSRELKCDTCQKVLKTNSELK